MGNDVMKATVTNNSVGLYVLVIEDITDHKANVTILKPGESSRNSVEAFGVMDEKGNFVKAIFNSKVSEMLGKENAEAMFWKIRDGAEVEINGTISIPLIEPKGLMGNTPGMVTPSTPEAWGIDGKNPVSERVSLDHEADARYASLAQQLQAYLQENLRPEDAKRVLEMVMTNLEDEKARKSEPSVTV